MWTLTAGGSVIDLRVVLLADLEDFVSRHRPCGQLTGDATEPAAGARAVSDHLRTISLPLRQCGRTSTGLTPMSEEDYDADAV
jgi:hypothetical protein